MSSFFILLSLYPVAVTTTAFLVHRTGQSQEEYYAGVQLLTVAHEICKIPPA